MNNAPHPSSSVSSWCKPFIYPLQSDSTKMAGNYDDLDIAGLQLKCNEKTDETLESTRRMMEMCAEAKQASWDFKML